eukprot:scaffold139603_cov31-Tisochrysis_lutea.AAC.1
MADDDGHFCNLARDEARLPLSKDKPHVVSPTARVPKRVAAANVAHRRTHLCNQAGSPSNALVEEQGHVKQRGLSWVERSGVVIVQ